MRPALRGWKAEIWQDKMMVCRVTGETDDDVRTEIGHYAAQYAQDGPLEVRVRGPKQPRSLEQDEKR